MNRALTALYLAGFCGYTASSILFPVIAPHAKSLGATESLAGVIAGAYAYITALTMIPFGALADRFGETKFIVFGQIIYVVAPIFYVLATNPVQLFLARIFHGFALSLFIPAANALVIDRADPQRRGEALGWIAAVTQLGFAVGPGLGGFLAYSYGTNSAFVACSLISLVGLGSVIAGVGLGEERKQSQISSAETTLSWMRSPLVWASLLSSLVAAFGTSATGSFSLPLYAPEIGISTTYVGFMVTLLYLSSALVRVPAGKLSDRIGRVPVIILGLTIEALGIALIPTFNSLFSIIFALILCGAGVGLVNPSGFALLSDLLPTTARGIGMGFANAFLQAGVALGPTLMGVMTESTGFRGIFLISASIIFVTSIIVFALSRTKIHEPRDVRAQF